MKKLFKGCLCILLMCVMLLINVPTVQGATVTLSASKSIATFKKKKPSLKCKRKKKFAYKTASGTRYYNDYTYLSWSKVSGASYYQVYDSEEATRGEYAEFIKTKKTKYTFEVWESSYKKRGSSKYVLSGSHCYVTFKVRGVKVVNGKKYYTKWSKSVKGVWGMV